MSESELKPEVFVEGVSQQGSIFYLEGQQAAVQSLSDTFERFMRKDFVDFYRKEFVSKIPGSEIEDKIKDTVHWYMHGRREYNRVPLSETIAPIRQVTRTSIALLKAITDMPEASKMLFNKHSAANAQGNKALTLTGLTNSVEFIRQCAEEISNPNPKRGRKAHNHTTDAVKALAKLWASSTGEKFRVDLEDDIGKDNKREFRYIGAKFVTEMLRAIEPDVPLSEIETSIRKFARQAKVRS